MLVKNQKSLKKASVAVGVTMVMLFSMGIALSFVSPTNFVVKSYTTTTPRPSPAPPSSDQVGDEWPMFHAAFNHSGSVTTTAAANAGKFWNYTTTGQVASSPAIFNGRVYFGSGSGDDHVYCMNATNGSLLWSRNLNGAVDDSPAIAGGYVYIGSGTGNESEFCLNANTGAIVWHSWLPDHGTPTSAVVANGSVYIGSSNGITANSHLYAFDALNGTLQWSYTAGTDWIESAPAIHGNLIYFGCDNGSIFCVHALTHNTYRQFNTPGGSEVSSPAVINGRLYAGCSNNIIYCLNDSTFVSLWSFSAGTFFDSSPAVANGKVYIGSEDDKLYCLDAITGAQLWSYTTGGWIESSPAIAAGHVIVGSQDGTVTILDAATGMFQWSFQTSGYVDSSPAVANGRIYVGSTDHQVYCLPIITAPSEPRSLIADPVSGHIHVSWWVPLTNGGSAIIGYKIYRGATYGGETLYQTIANVTSYDDTSVTAGTLYYYHATAINSFFEGPVSQEAPATVGTPPSAPQNLAATSAAGSGSVVLTWQTPASAGSSSITGYRISRSTTSGYEFIMQSLGVVTTWTDTSVESGVTYYYKVCAVNSVGLGAFSSEISVTPSVASNPPDFTHSFNLHSGSFNSSFSTSIGGLNITATGTVSGNVSLVISAWTSNPLSSSPGFSSDSNAIYLYMSSNNTSAITFPVTITVPLPSSLQGKSASDLKFMTYDNAQGKWVDAGFTITVSADGKTATITVAHFSMYSLGQPASSGGGSTPGYSLWIVSLVAGLAMLAECVAIRKRKLHVN
ncbi:MAG TPA: PQQ-binding-like beta-propeller repeat protein [Candidatus Lokiarchaeia archaeon]|nr:PQQ-binding-like beta-propeller repeat protein [Candidatus Lokiarchaeia archaeon]